MLCTPRLWKKDNGTNPAGQIEDCRHRSSQFQSGTVVGSYSRGINTIEFVSSFYASCNTSRHLKPNNGSGARIELNPGFAPGNPMLDIEPAMIGSANV